MPKVYQVQVRHEQASSPWDKLSRILESLLPVAFHFLPVAGDRPDGIISYEAAGQSKEAVGFNSSLTVPRPSQSPPQQALREIAVTFADDDTVPFPFRGRALRFAVRADPTVLTLGQDERVLARIDKGPIWTVSKQGTASHFRTGLALPAIPSGGGLQDVLNGQSFIELLPLLHFLQDLCAGTLYQKPPLRACFMFDDPNLHWPNYGYVNFAEIAAHAARHSYHVSFATIPLDAWFTHNATAALFRSNADRLSLLVHGNNHVKKELGLTYSTAERVALLEQATRRIERLERSARLKVCRVMAAPHGACSEAMLEQLPKSGFESACISHGSLQAHNPGRPWTEALGYRPTEVICGCPVLPRWSLDGDLTNTILLAAFLGQPLVLRGHHWDLQNGVALLDRWASFINGLGSVVWANMTTLTRLNYQWQVADRVLKLQPLAQRVSVRLPGGVSSVMVDGSNNGTPAQWRIVNAAGQVLTLQSGQPIHLPEGSGATLSLDIATTPSTAPNGHRMRPQLAAIARRLATEGRDRLALLVSRS